jgi:hypothetical protein
VTTHAYVYTPHHTLSYPGGKSDSLGGSGHSSIALAFDCTDALTPDPVDADADAAIGRFCTSKLAPDGRDTA